MLWSIIGVIGGGSFIINGFGILSDPNCDSVSFGGGRVVQATCYQAGGLETGAISGTLAGMGMVAVGFLFLYFAWRNFKRS